MGGVLVTATASTAVSGSTYLYQANSRLRTVFTFGTPIPGFKAETSFHNDCSDTVPVVPGCFEQFNFTGKDSSGTIVFSKTLRNVDGAFSFVPGSGAGELSGLIATLEVDYSFDTPIAEYLRGSYLNLWLTTMSISPSPQTVSGPVGTAIAPTDAFTAVGFSAAITYTVTGGTLPAGLVPDPATGVISGTPTEPSNGTVTITATGGSAGVAIATVTFSIGVSSGGSMGNEVPPAFTG